MERFAESYANEDRSVPPGNSLFALAAQAFATTDTEGLEASLPNDTKEDVERICEIYRILVAKYGSGLWLYRFFLAKDQVRDNHIQGFGQDIRS